MISRKLRNSRKRKAVSSIIGGVLVFGMIFSVGTAYFYSITQSQFAYQKTVSQRDNFLSLQTQERLLVTGMVSAKMLQFYLNNTGISATMVAYWIINGSGFVIQYKNSSLTTYLPAYLGQGQSVVFNPGITYANQTYTIKVLTQRGSNFIGIYSTAANNNPIIQSLTASAIGDVYITWSSYSYYKIASCGPNQCLQRQGQAFTVPTSWATSNQMALGIRVVDLNPQQNNITLDMYTTLSNLLVPGCQGCNFNTVNWYIVSNSSSGQIQSTYSPITLFYNKPQTIIFGSKGPGSFSPFTISGGTISPPEIALVFITTHGCEAIALSQCNSNTFNYGQSIPYVSTLYS